MSDRTWVLYGAGGVGRRAGEALQNAGHQVVGYLDQAAKPGQTLRGLPVVTPLAAPRAWREHRCAITIFNRSVHGPTVAHDLRSEGWHQVTTYLDLFHQLAGKLEDQFWLTARSRVEAARPQWEPLTDRWADATSRELFIKLLLMRTAGMEPEGPLPGHKQVQYLPDDIPGWRSEAPLNYVDGGAYDGSSILALLNANQALHDVHAFEPDPTNYRLLSLNSEEIARRIHGLPHYWPCGLADHSGPISFQSGAGEASHISLHGNTTITGISLDKTLPFHHFDMVKLDVEGGEASTLLGMSNHISRNLPRLAISLYHRWDDLWVLPALVNKLSGECYRLYLRSHGHSGFDTVLYALKSA